MKNSSASTFSTADAQLRPLADLRFWIFCALILLFSVLAWAVAFARVHLVYMVLSYLSCLMIVTAFVLKYASRQPFFAHPFQLVAGVLTVEVFVAPVWNLFLGVYQRDLLMDNPRSEQLLAHSFLLVTLGVVSLMFGEWTAVSVLGRARKGDGRDNASDETPARQDLDRLSSSRTVSGMLCLSLLSSLITYVQCYGFGLSSSLDVAQRIGERRLSVSGLGYVSVLYVCGTSAVILLAHRFAVQSRFGRARLAPLLTAWVIAGLPYLLLGQRGGAFYPLLFVLLTISTVNRRRNPIFLALPLLFPALAVADIVTCEVRTALMEARIPFVDMDYTTMTGPGSFCHIELLSAVIDSVDNGVQYPSTISSSLLNWLPKQLFPWKGLTTGPCLAIALSPTATNAEGEHLTSFTTGPILEMYYHGGAIGIILGLYALGMTAGFLVEWYERGGRTSGRTLVFIFNSYIIGWDSWVNDLGGSVNNAVLFWLSFAVLLVVSGCWLPAAARRG